MVGMLLGSAAVVEYSCTGKLVTVLTNYPQIIMVAATPALSEMWASGRRHGLLDTVVALMLLMLTVSGLIACLVLSVNSAFVAWWVGPEQFGGSLLTWLFALLLVLRHLNITLIYGLLAFGGERRISITNMIEGSVALALSLALIPLIGALGAVCGALIAVAAVSLPANVRALGRAAGITPMALVGHMSPWGWRFVLMAMASAAVPWLWHPAGAHALVTAAAGVAGMYSVVMAAGLRQGPLGTYVAPRLGRYLPPRLQWIIALSPGS
jgi:O-antigen/teichoic acid export membrane protein